MDSSVGLAAKALARSYIAIVCCGGNAPEQVVAKPVRMLLTTWRSTTFNSGTLDLYGPKPFLSLDIGIVMAVAVVVKPEHFACHLLAVEHAEFAIRIGICSYSSHQYSPWF
jgi:hypothetical protein